MKMAETKLKLSDATKAALIRVARMVIAQLPAFIAWAQGNGIDPKLVAIGIALNGIAKLLRDMFPGWIIWLPL
jgi:hypothetical protein